MSKYNCSHGAFMVHYLLVVTCTGFSFCTPCKATCSLFDASPVLLLIVQGMFYAQRRFLVGRRTDRGFLIPTTGDMRGVAKSGDTTITRRSGHGSIQRDIKSRHLTITSGGGWEARRKGAVVYMSPTAIIAIFEVAERPAVRYDYSKHYRYCLDQEEGEAYDPV